MPDSSIYRKVNTFEFRPVYTSLGIDRSAFKSGARPRSKIFDAALNVDPNILWLFKDTKCHRYNLAQQRFESEDMEFAGTTWPPLFSRGIDAASYAVSFPTWLMFRKNKVIWANLGPGGSWIVRAESERDIKTVFRRAEGTWFANGCDAVLLDRIAGENKTILHIFGGDRQYMRINLGDDQRSNSFGVASFAGFGALEIAPKPISEQFNLPEPFASTIDLAFHDQGNAVFFSGDMCADFDLRDNKVLDVQAIEQRFPAFTKYLPRPQIFLVENYVLETYVGPPTRGRLVDTRTVLPGSTLKLTVVTERVSASQTTLQESILESQNNQVAQDFNERMDNETQRSEGSETYRYQMDADFHGEAKASSVWGGEINAQLAVRGGTDSNRKSFTEAAFKAVTSQVREASESFKQKTYTAGQTIENRERVINEQYFEIVGDPDITRTFSFYQRLEPYYALLVLRDVQVAYGDGSGAGFAPTSLSALPRLLEEKLASQEDRTRLLGYLGNELSAIADERGQATTIFANGTSGNFAFDLKPNPSATFEIQLPDGQTQIIVVRGLLIKAAKDWLSSTTQTFPLVDEQ